MAGFFMCFYVRSYIHLSIMQKPLKNNENMTQQTDKCVNT